MGFAFLAGIIAAGVAAGLIVFLVIGLTVKGITSLAKKLFAKRAKKVLAAEIDELVKKCPNKKSMKELEKLEEKGATHIVAGVSEEGELVDDIISIKDSDDEIPYEVIDLLGEEGMVVIEAA